MRSFSDADIDKYLKYTDESVNPLDETLVILLYAVNS